MRDVFIGRGLTKIVDLLFPLRCPVCDGIVPAGEGKVCRVCRRKIRYVSEPRCQKCGRQLNDDTKPFCTACAQTQHIFDRGIALYDYQSMKKSVYRFKYKKRCEYAAFYAEEIYRHFKTEILNMGADAIIPIPLHKSRLKSRGYNQAELIAAHLSRLTGIPLEKNLVKRVRKTVPQKQLDARARQNNLKKAFNIKPNVVKLNKTILIDDIFTTGSTIDAVAKELKRRGVETVYFITLCIGEGF
ncbi:MAG: ComF family protein [Lachnospiraceae bacterium]|nr:ComF family protein [Lachnospiraceae bacterium]